MAKCIGESLKKKFYNRFFRKVKYSWMTIRPNSSYLKEVVDMVEQKKLNIRIDSVFPLSKLGDAFQRAESDECKGKVVILNSFKNYKKID
ncbi:hypothetical protein MHBO_000422 [Bonamia ostreae]|uniref:Alcohol dehydrogenase n=1 Tax=Bonamia ostreae TaxID=126728 RepID=A0ABV2AFI0_9EUKA